MLSYCQDRVWVQLDPKHAERATSGETARRLQCSFLLPAITPTEVELDLGVVATALLLGGAGATLTLLPVAML